MTSDASKEDILITHAHFAMYKRAKSKSGIIFDGRTACAI
jgi:hypothetical protein